MKDSWNLVNLTAALPMDNIDLTGFGRPLHSSKYQIITSLPAAERRRAPQHGYGIPFVAHRGLPRGPPFIGVAAI
jgi:hypothetical protein